MKEKILGKVGYLLVNLGKLNKNQTISEAVPENHLLRSP